MPPRVDDGRRCSPARTGPSGKSGDHGPNARHPSSMRSHVKLYGISPNFIFNDLDNAAASVKSVRHDEV